MGERGRVNMNPRKRNEVERALIKKGFRKSQNDHSKFVYHLKNGKKTSVWTKTSHGSSHREISPTNLGKMARQCIWICWIQGAEDED